MASVNLSIGFGAVGLARASAISKQLLALSVPKQPVQDVTSHLFDWRQHPITGEVVLEADGERIIKIHPDNDLDTLIALNPNITEQERIGMITALKNLPEIAFKHLVPTTSITYTQEQMEQNGWFS